MSTEMASALLDPSESARRARPLRHWSKARQDLVRSQFAAIHRAWCVDWLPADEAAAHDADVLVSESEADEEPVPGDAVCWSFGDTLTVTRGRTPLHAVARAMFGTDVTTTAPGREVPAIAEGVVRAAWNDWLQRIVSSPALAGSELRKAPPSRGTATVAASRWTGGLWLRWRWCGGAWRLGLPHRAVAALVGNEPAKGAPQSVATAAIPLEQALARERIALRMVLAGAELNLGQLQALRPGDVIPLAHPLAAPLKVIAANGASLCEGWLGQREGRIAIEMTRPAADPSNNHSVKEKNR
jgi:flagellar motor switch/type III secretory pathway protein FliN